MTELHNTVCPDCLSLPVINPPLCRSCGCARKDCKCDNKAEYKQIVAPYYYKDNVVLAVHRYKSSDMRFLSARFARDMAKTANDNYSDISFDTVTFVLMTKLSSFKRDIISRKFLRKSLRRYLKYR
ncbi:MAG: hypothetical protein LUG95_03420 [Clostridiales bacterium]|nr:hypothetical protein [Clostridiales bacterium]